MTRKQAERIVARYALGWVSLLEDPEESIYESDSYTDEVKSYLKNFIDEGDKPMTDEERDLIVAEAKKFCDKLRLVFGKS